MPFPLRRERRASKGLPLFSIEQELHADFVITKISEVLGAIGIPEWRCCINARPSPVGWVGQ
jgi:hypothetical protein